MSYRRGVNNVLSISDLAFLLSPSPKSQSQDQRQRTWADTKITWATNQPTFNREGYSDNKC